MLCKDGELTFNCDVEVSGWYVRVSIRRTGRSYRLDLSSVLDVTYEELSGKLLVTLAGGRTVEMQPQSAEDRDAVSKVLALFVLMKSPSSIDLIGRVLKAFARSVDAALNLALALRETGYGINWRRISALAEEVVNTVKRDEDVWVGLSWEDVHHLREAVSRRDIRGTLASVKSFIASLYRSAGLTLSRVLPGTSPEVLLDLVLAGVSHGALRALEAPPGEKESRGLEEILGSSLKRFVEVMNVEESLAEKLEASVRSGLDAEGLADSIVGALAESYQRAVRVSQEASRPSG